MFVDICADRASVLPDLAFPTSIGLAVCRLEPCAVLLMLVQPCLTLSNNADQRAQVLLCRSWKAVEQWSQYGSCLGSHSALDVSGQGRAESHPYLGLLPV